MIHEKKKVLTHRIIWLSILLIVILIPIFSMKTVEDLEIVEKNCYIDYDSYLKTTDCEVNITFNFSVRSGYVTINFYDENDKLLKTDTSYYFSDGCFVENTWIYVNGKVESYEIVSYDIEPVNNIFYLYLLIPFALGFFISSLLVCYKKYDLDGNEIIVYAGYYHHYIKINGEQYDEHNTLVSWTPIYLSCLFNENRIETTISLTNRIATKFNGRLLKNIM